MTMPVLGASDVLILDPNAVSDSVSLLAGNQDGYSHCGDRVFSITANSDASYTDVLELDVVTHTLTLGLAGTTFGHEGDYSIEIEMRLKDYPTVKTTATFTASVTACEIETLTPTSIDSEYYDVYTPSISFSHIDFVQTPDCLYTLTYTYEILDAGTGTLSALPAFITESDKTLTVETDDPSDVANYQIQVSSTHGSATNSFIIDLEVANACD